MFLCNYCGIEHPDNRRSREHVVPRKLFSPSYVLDDVCRERNGYFAASFETDVMTSRSMREVLLLVEKPPPSKTVRLEDVETEDGKVFPRWWAQGREVLGELPTWRTVDHWTITVVADDDRELPFEISLPFTVAVQATGAAHLSDPSSQMRHVRET